MSFKNLSELTKTYYSKKDQALIKKAYNFASSAHKNQKRISGEPYMIHRALLGSLERFFGVLIEHYAGAFPLWLAPEQIWVIPIGSSHRKYAQEIAENLQKENRRVKTNFESETVSKKIRSGELYKIPYLLVVGDKEMKNKTIRVRSHNKGDLGEMKLNKFLEKISKQIRERS